MKSIFVLVFSLMMLSCDSLDEVLGLIIELDNRTDYKLDIEVRIRYPQEFGSNVWEEGTCAPKKSIRLKDPVDDFEGEYTVKIHKAQYKDNPPVVLFLSRTINIRHDEITDASFLLEGNAVDGFRLTVK